MAIPVKRTSPIRVLLPAPGDAIESGKKAYVVASRKGDQVVIPFGNYCAVAEAYGRLHTHPEDSMSRRLFPGGSFYRIDKRARHDGGALAADIGQTVAFVQAGVFQQPIVAGVAAKGILPEGFGRAAVFAFAAGTIKFEEAALPFDSRRGCNGGIGDHASQPPAAPLVRDQHVMVAETADTGNIGHMLVGPVAHELLFIEIMRGRQVGTPKSRLFKKPVDPLIDAGNQPVGLDIGDGPRFGAERAPVVGSGDRRIEGQKIGDYRTGAWQKVPRQPMGWADDCFQFDEERILGVGKSYQRRFPSGCSFRLIAGFLNHRFNGFDDSVLH